MPRARWVSLPTAVLTPVRLSRVWGADARLTAEHGRTGLHVAWLGTTVLRPNIPGRADPAAQRLGEALQST